MAILTGCETLDRTADVQQTEPEKGAEATGALAGPAAAPGVLPTADQAQPSTASAQGPRGIAGRPARQDRQQRADASSSADASPSAAVRTMVEAVRRAIENNPRISLAGAKVDEARAGVDVARSALFPQLDGSVASGHGVGGNFYPTDGSAYYFNSKRASGSWRTDLTATGQQLLYDFGATSSDIERARSSRDSLELNAAATTEEVAANAADAYLNVLLHRELLALAKENVAKLREIAQLVEESQKAGNATVADVKRVGARLSEAEASEGDETYELHLAVDVFRRLARAEPGDLRPAPLLTRAIPPNQQEALVLGLRQNPLIQSLEVSLKSRQSEIEAIKAAGLPKVTFNSDTSFKHYNQNKTNSELELRNMVTLRYTFLDGGRRSAQIDEASSRLAQTEAALRDQRETLEADLRKFYWIRDNARGKTASLASAVSDSEKARELYREQFGGGKRSLLELLDVQAAAYTAMRNQILNRNEERRATYGILRSLGRLVPTLLAAPPA